MGLKVLFSMINYNVELEEPSNNNVPVSTMKGVTINSIDINKSKDILVFRTDAGDFALWHYQDCCECVTIEDIVGDLEDLIGVPLLYVEEDSSKKEDDWGTETYTFYNLRTIKGDVTIRWYGSSNGYYSEEVDFCRY